MNYAGPVERIVDVHLMRPDAKARAALARMRDARVPPSRLLVNYLAVCCAIERDPIRAGSEAQDYRRVQVAKACFRLASGYHAVYGPGMRYDRYPRSSGLSLRHLGKTLEACCEHVHDRHLGAVMKLAEEKKLAAAA